MLRNDTLLPKCKKSTTANDEPRRLKLRCDRLLPNYTRLHTDSENVEPNRAIPSKETPEPKRA